MKKLLSLTGALLVLMLAITTGLNAHSGATGIVKERMDVMKSIGKAMKSLGAMAKGKAELSQSAIESAAGAIWEHCETVTGLFPDTEQSRKGHLTEAAPAIWENKEEFQSLLHQMADHAKELGAAAAGLDRPGLGRFIGKLANDCKSCHQKFRIKKH
ncbi:MAG: cytochrome c [Pseudomonadota bacterium]